MNVDPHPHVDQALSSMASDDDAELLYAADYGSHDALLMGPWSDRDVAVIVAYHPLKHGQATDLPSRVTHTETIDGEEINIAGINLAEFVQQAVDSESDAVTIMAADRVYCVSPDVEKSVSELRSYVREQFNPPELITHFNRLARSNYRYATSDDWTYTGSDGPQWTIEERGDQQYLITGLLGYPDKMAKRPVSEAIEDGVLDHKKASPTVRQNIRIARALLSGQHVAATGTLPPSDFDELVTARRTSEAVEVAPPLSDEMAETLTTLAKRKRAGEGDTEVGLVIDEWATPIIESDEFARSPGRVAAKLEDAAVETPTSRAPDETVLNERVDEIRTQLFLE